ncbi:glycosyltransferase [Pseudalkalibacillus decolorationis]|uniref:glycosyltransferase n=1 Tax=Pseudalkalibacillus decolorationis TaxID=163879 RepID=UPI00214843B9|nr:glycosyltransferase [Pseudalkalibacillus decolorationis]
MIMKSQTLVLITQNFPYLPGEHFLETELQFLAEKFERIYVSPVAYQKNNTIRSAPENVIVKALERQLSASKCLTFIQRTLSVLGDPQGVRWLVSDWKEATRFGLKGILKLINWVSMAVNIRKQLETEYVNGNPSLRSYVFYSYWLSPAAIALAMLKEKKDNIIVVSRAHGGDLYAYRHTPAYMPLQPRVISKLSKVYLISEDGRNYLEKNYRDIQLSNLEVSRLGTLKPGQVNYEAGEEGLHLVTCSYMLPVKRLSLLIEALNHIKTPIKWTHIGDGPLKEELISLANKLPSHVQWDFIGNLTNKEVLKFYLEENVDLFINVSESEGVPVSIMEAFSCGVPVIATNVGGTAELVNEKNGKLLNKDIAPIQITNAIEEFGALMVENKLTKSSNAYNMWSTHYNAEKNYWEFAKHLYQLGEMNIYEVQ